MKAILLKAFYSWFPTGFSLAGIYPVGMKIASDYFKEGLGTSLGYLVGALVLGTAFPHLLKFFAGSEGLPWKFVLILTSALAFLGGILIILLVPDGPYRRPMHQKNFSTFLNVFKVPRFRAAAFGYFGHMWELYAFWAFLPLILTTYKILNPESIFNISLISFVIIGVWRSCLHCRRIYFPQCRHKKNRCHMHCFYPGLLSYFSLLYFFMAAGRACSFSLFFGE